MEESEEIRERLAAEENVREKIDEQGNRWVKVYFGGGAHFQNWLEQAKELGEVEVEEVDSKGFACFEATGERLYRIWVKFPESEAPSSTLDELWSAGG